MGVPELLSSQRDFSAGELDAEMKRRDDQPITKAGGRQMADWRILSSGNLEQRPGRRALYPQTGRVDQVDVNNVTYDICFGGDGSLAIRDGSGISVAVATFPWVTASVDRIVWTKVNVDTTRTDIVITFPGMKPAIASFSAPVWTFPAFAFSTDGVGAALVPFKRIAAFGAVMTPSAIGAAGAGITIHFSAPVLVGAHVGALFRLAGRRMLITGVSDSQNANATCIDALLGQQVLTVALPDGAVGGTGVQGFTVGQVVTGTLSGTTGEVIAVNVGASQVTVQITNFASGFIVSAAGPPIILELLEGPSGKSKVTAAAAIGTPIGAVSWDEQIMSDARGWPQSCATDDSRLIFCDLPGSPPAIVWSATGQPYNFNVGAQATDAICELIAGKPRVYHVGPWIDEIVFTDQGIYYIPINTTNPLKPGSVSFQKFSPEAASFVKPAFTSDGYLYINAGQNSVKAILSTGAAFSTKPYGVQDITEFHKHLFVGIPHAIAISTGDGAFPERYVYVVMSNDLLVMGRYEADKKWVGWVPWHGSAAVKWVSALHSDVRFVSVYPVLGNPAGVSIAEILDETEYLDAAIPINALPPRMAPPGGKGPFWFAPLQAVQLLDGTRPLGAHAIDANGFIIPAYQGEDLTIATITGGYPYQPTFEPFIPGGQPGQDVKQRSLRRNLGRVIVSVMNSSGLVLASLYSGKDGPNLPAQGSVMKQFRVPTWNQGDDQSKAPFLREDTYRQRFSGRAFEQRAVVFKDVPGPLKIVEVAIEASA